MKQAPLTQTQLDTLRRRLEEERGRIRRVLETPAGGAPPRDQTIELEERAQHETDASRQRGLLDRERALLAEVERALGRIEAGTYGISEVTGDPIPYERLVALPWTRRGVDE